MVTFLKGRRRDDDSVVAVDKNGANIAAALEALVRRAETAAEQLRQLAPVLERAAELDTLRERCAAVERQVQDLEGLGTRLTEAERQAERLVSAGEEMDRIQNRMGDLGHKVEGALQLREDVERVLSMEGPVTALRSEAESLRGQIAEMSEGVGRIRSQHDDALSAHRHTTTRLEAIDQEHQAAQNRLEETTRKLQTVERSLDPLTQATESIPGVQHQLAVLKSLADHLAQKTTSLEQQREAVDRAAGQISKLTVMDRELDTWLRRQEEQIRRFDAIETKIAEVQALHVKVMARNDELQGAQQAARQALADLRKQMRKSSESFELENRGLHAVSERVGDLRAAVKECEARFAVLDAASQGAAAVQAQVRSLTEQAGALTQELVRQAEEARRIAVMRENAEHLETLAGDTAERMQRIEVLKPQLDEAVRQLASLKGTHEMMADGLEQMRLAQAEMIRVRESHAETQNWLTTTDGWTRKVEAQVKDLQAMEPAVERIRADVEEVRAAMGEIESRRASLEEVHRRLGDLGTVSAELKERAEGLRVRMDGAEGRFTQL